MHMYGHICYVVYVQSTTNLILYFAPFISPPLLRPAIEESKEFALEVIW